MSETQVLLGRIAALRQRLEQARGLVQDADAAGLLGPPGLRADPGHALCEKVAAGARAAALLEETFRHLPAPDAAAGADGPLPDHLSARARNLVPRVRELLAQLRPLADHALLALADDDPAAGLHREATVLAELAVRVLQTLPESPGFQFKLCEGVDAVVRRAQQRVHLLESLLHQRQRDAEQVAALAAVLRALADRARPDLAPLTALADDIVAEAAQSRPLRLLQGPAHEPAQFVACHSLNTAQVAARLARALPEWRARARQVVLAALLHDVGMLGVPAELLASPGRLEEGQQRLLERHPQTGAEWLDSLGPAGPGLREVAAGHHERLDGTGYPAGLRDLQVGPLVRFVAVCDVYAALCSSRPHRPALDARTAATDTLLLAHQGGLDATCAQALLELSLYPVGTAVELADGMVGVVVATHRGRGDLNTCARPVVALLMDAQGKPLPRASHVDLEQCEDRSIVRAVPPGERRALLGPHHPEWA